MVSAPAWWIALLVGVPAARAAPPALRPGLLALLSLGVLLAVAPGAALTVLGLALGVWWAPAGLGARATPALLVGLVAVLASVKVRAELGAAQGLLVPLGLSFAVFRLMHYVIERARGTLPAHGLADYLAWILLFPVFSAGPVERLDHHLRHREPGPWREDLAAGVQRIAVGLVKKLLIADGLIAGAQPFASTRTLLLQLEHVQPGEAAASLALSFAWLYMDFSAYCDLAVGAGRLLGLRVSENFNWPVLARDMSELWRRWHISLSAWCMAYVYLPLIGLTRSPALAVFATFLVMGLWHAPSAHWVAWGLWHGAGVWVSLSWQRLRRRRGWRLPPGLSWLGLPPTLAWATGAHAFTMMHGHGGAWDGVRLLGCVVGLRIPAWPW